MQGDRGGSHYASHSQFYHPEKQQRKQPEQFWFTHQPPPPPHFPPPNPPPHPHPHLFRHLPPPPPPPALSQSQQHLWDPQQPSQTHSNTDSITSQQESIFLEQELKTSHPTLSRHHSHSDVEPPAPFIQPTTTERVSAVDLIKQYQNIDDNHQNTDGNHQNTDGNHHNFDGNRQLSTQSKSSETLQRSSMDSVAAPLVPPSCPPPWLYQEREGNKDRLLQGQSNITQRDDTHEERQDEVSGREEGKSQVREIEFPWMTEEEEEVGQYESSFVAEVQKFVQRNSETFNIVTKEILTMETTPTLHNLKSEASFKYAEPEALEYHMQVDKNMRRKSFLKLIEVGDVMRGHVVAKRHSGLTVQITSFVDSHKYRELSDLSIKGVVFFDNLADNVEKCEEVMRDMQLDDVIQAVVLRAELEDEVLVLSFRNSDYPGMKDDSLLGYRPGRRPTSPCSSNISKHDFLNQLMEDQGFVNPEAVPNLYRHLGLSTPSSSSSSSSLRPTLIKGLQIAEYDEADFAEPLRKAQRFKWSMKTVAVGVAHFKSGKHETAAQCLNHALDIDPSNVEGLVARGALLATTGKYKEGIADFRKALTIKNTHKNARNYFVETQVVYGKELEEQGKIDSAMECYREALDLNPDEETAKARLNSLTVAMETKTVKLREREREVEEEKEKMFKLRKMIEKEKRKRLKEKKPKPKKRRKSGSDREPKKHKKRSKKTSKHSDESTSESESDEERERGKRDSSKGRKDKRQVEKRREKSRTRDKSSSRARDTPSDDVTTDSNNTARGSDKHRRKPRKQNSSTSDTTSISPKRK